MAIGPKLKLFLVNFKLNLQNVILNRIFVLKHYKMQLKVLHALPGFHLLPLLPLSHFLLLEFRLVHQNIPHNNDNHIPSFDNTQNDNHAHKLILRHHQVFYGNDHKNLAMEAYLYCILLEDISYQQSFPR
ncbi:unnamed protein product [Rhizophagus irregularis]|nr:unnamed protein product [Rhizophagus irregularis]